MIRKKAIEQEIGVDRFFRWRGGEVSRIEAFSDAVFAFAVTLLVVSLEVPVTFTELTDKMFGFIPFGITFLMFMQVWYWYYKYFRRFDLRDTFTIALNAALLFVVLMYVFPLKFLFTLLVNQIRGLPETVLVNGHLETVIEGSQWNILMLIYGAGYVAVHSLFVLLYWHAYRMRGTLELNPLEVRYTTNNMWPFVCIVSVGVVSMAVAVLGGPESTSWAGYTYILIAPVVAVFRAVAARRIHALEARYGSTGKVAAP